LSFPDFETSEWRQAMSEEFNASCQWYMVPCPKAIKVQHY